MPPFDEIRMTAMLSFQQHKFYSLLEEKLRAITALNVEGSLDAMNLLDRVQIDPLMVINTKASISHRENETNTLKALVLAKYIISYMTGPQDTVQIMRTVDELRNVFLDSAKMETLLEANFIKLDENPFEKFRKGITVKESDLEWQGLLDFANYLKYALKLMRDPPNKVISMRAAAILSGFEKCLEGGWSGLGAEAKRRHLIYHFLTGIHRAPRTSKKRSEPTPPRAKQESLPVAPVALQERPQTPQQVLGSATPPPATPPPVQGAPLSRDCSFSLLSLSRNVSISLDDLDMLIADLEGDLDLFHLESVFDDYPATPATAAEEDLLADGLGGATFL